jgi:hypothetical protein
VTITHLFPRHTAASVSWSDPEIGNSPVTGFTVTANPGGATVQAGADARTAIVGGLVNGTEYTFSVVARNAVGTGDPSPPSGTVTPQAAEKPMSPTITSAVPLYQRIDLQWVAPPDGGAPITGYRVVANPGGHTVTTTPGTTVASITGLTNGTTYTVDVTATNLAGTGPAGSRGALVPAAARTPAAPVDLMASVPAAGQVTLTWEPPADTGTSAITGYVVTTSPATVETPATAPAVTLTGLAAGTEYRFTVRARNASGLGTASRPTDPLAPAVTVRKTPIVLSAQSLASLRTIHSDGVLAFEQPPAQITGLVAGDLITASISAQTPDGLLRKVIGTESRGGLLLVGTVEAPITDVVANPGVVWSNQVSTADLAHSDLRLPPGIQLATPTTDGPAANEVVIRDGTVEFTFQIAPRKSRMAGLTGTITLKPDIGGDLGKQRIRVATDWTTQAKVRLGAFVEWSGEYFPIKIPLAKQQVRIGPVIIIMQEYMRLSLAIEADGSVGIEADVTTSGRHGANLWIENGAPGGSLISELKPASATLAAFYGAASFRYGPRIELGVEFYGRAGRYAGATISLFNEYTIDTSENPYAEISFSPKLSTWIGVPGLLGEQGTFDKDWPIPSVGVWDSGGPFVGVAVTPPHTTTPRNRAVKLTAEVVNHAIVPITWSVVSGPGTIDQNGNYSSPEDGTAVIEADAADETIRDGRAEVVVGAEPPDPPNNVTAAGTPQSLRVTWERAHDGGSPLVGYVITTVPESTTVVLNQADATSAYVSGANLKASQRYLVRVQAVNLLGLSEPATTTREATPGGPLLRPQFNTAITTDPLGRRDAQADAGRTGVVVSGNGRYVVFAARGDSNLAPPEVYRPDNTQNYLVRKDLVTGSIVVASKDGPVPVEYSIPRGIGDFFWDVSADGDTVAFTRSDHVASRILVHTISTGTTWRPTDDMATGSMAYDPRLSADGRTVAFLARVGPSSSENPHHLYRRVLGGGLQQISNCQFIQGCDHPATSLDMSDDGKRIVYEESRYSVNPSGVAVLWDSAAGRRNLTPGPANYDTRGLQPVISGDGNTVAAYYLRTDDTGTTRQGLAVAPVSTGIGPEDILPDSILFRTQDFNKDGTVLAYVDRAAGRALQAMVLNLRTGARTGLGGLPLLGDGNEESVSISDSGTVVVWRGLTCGESFIDICDTNGKPRAYGWAQRLG